MTQDGAPGVRRFLVDENLPQSLADWLEAAGHDAQHVHDAGLHGHPDAAVYAYAQEHGQIIITSDVGLGNVRQYPPPHRGIVLVRLQDTVSIEARIRVIVDGLDTLGDVSFEDAVVTIEAGRARIRR